MSQDISHDQVYTSQLGRFAQNYAKTGLWLSIISIILATLITSLHKSGSIGFADLLDAQLNNPAIWVLDVIPFLFIFWSKAFYNGLTKKAEAILHDKTEEFRTLNTDLTIRLKYASTHDKLTSLPNQNHFIYKVGQAIDRAKNDDLVAVIVLSIKAFRELQVNFGNYNANNIVRECAETLKKLIVQPFMLDVRMGICMLARLQGDSFALLMPNLDKNTNMEALLKNILEASTVDCMVDGNLIQVKMVASAALYPSHGDNAEILLQRAITGTFYAQRDGHDYAIYQQSMNDNLVISRSMLDELKTAIAEDALEIYYQPVIELDTGHILAAEALIRFNNPAYGLIQADKLIPLVEGMNLMKKLTFFVLEGVIKQQAIWREAGHFLRVSVNLSAADVVDLELPEIVLRLLQQYRVPPESLSIELTEKICLSEQGKTREVLQAFADGGVKICIEDFCSGFTSFGYLLNFPISAVKIDKSFIMHMIHDPKKHTMVKAMLHLASILHLQAGAVGIADEEILEKLRQEGCYSGQGFYFSRAVDAKAFTALLDNGLKRSFLVD